MLRRIRGATAADSDDRAPIVAHVSTRTCERQLSHPQTGAGVDRLTLPSFSDSAASSTELRCSRLLPMRFVPPALGPSSTYCRPLSPLRMPPPASYVPWAPPSDFPALRQRADEADPSGHRVWTGRRMQEQHRRHVSHSA
eukprot:scaffold85645_cov29-Tisochrysis_lutea.AAC.3